MFYINVINEKCEAVKQFNSNQEVAAKSLAACINGTLKYGCAHDPKLQGGSLTQEKG